MTRTCPPCDGACQQGRDCPAVVAPIGARIPGPEPLLPPTWRNALGEYARWALIIICAAFALAAILTGANA